MDKPATTRRLNLFLFPAETDARFLLLMVAVIGAGLFVYRTLANVVLQKGFQETMLACVGAPPVMEACWEPFERQQAFLMGGGLAVLLLVAYLFYRLAPAAKIRRSDLGLLAPEDAPELHAHLQALCRQLALPDCPRFLVHPLRASPSGLAFGAGRQHYVVLNGGLVPAYAKDRPLFDAVVLHELAHIKNRDVSKTQFAVQLWHAFLLTALLPFAISLVREVLRLGAGDLAFYFQVAWRAAALAAVVYITRNSLLRVREYYADARAAMQPGILPPLQAAVGAAAARTLPRRLFGAMHPQSALRAQALDDSSMLFRLGFLDALTAGLAVGVAVDNVTFWFTLLLPPELEMLAYIVAPALFASLLVGVVGLSAWRSAFVGRFLGRYADNLGRISVGVGLGLAVGRILSFKAAQEASIPISGGSVQWSASLLSDAGWLLILIAVLYVFLKWVKLGATAWLAGVHSPRTLRRVCAGGLVVGSILLTWWLSWLLLAVEVSHTLGAVHLGAIVEVAGQYLVQVLAHRPIGIGMSALALLYLLPGWIPGRRQATPADSSWAFVTSPPAAED